MLFKHNGKVNLSARGAETAKGNKVSFIGKLFGGKDENSNGEAAGTAAGTAVFEYEFSAEMSVEELQQIYQNNRNDMDQVESDMKKFMSAVTTFYNDGKKIVLDAIEEAHRNDIRDYERIAEIREASLELSAKKDELEKKFHPESETETKSE